MSKNEGTIPYIRTVRPAVPNAYSYFLSDATTAVRKSIWGSSLSRSIEAKNNSCRVARRAAVLSKQLHVYCYPQFHTHIGEDIEKIFFNETKDLLFLLIII
jgi:hypothetical protein